VSSRDDFWPRSWPDVGFSLILGVVYFGAGKLGLKLALVHPSATAVWAPTGITLAAFLTHGIRAWPGIYLGAFLVNLTTAGSLATSVGIATGNTLEGLIGAALVLRFANGGRAFERAIDILRFTILAAVVATAVSATMGVTSLAVGGFAPWRDYPAIWVTWWLGDAAGALIVAPLLILWARSPRPGWTAVQSLEAIALLLSMVLVGVLLYSGRSPLAIGHYQLNFLCVPLLMWAALRFGARGAASVCFVLSAIAIWGTVQGNGPYGSLEGNASLLVLQSFMCVTVVTTLTVSALVAERSRGAESLRLLESAVQNAVDGIMIVSAGREQSEPKISFVNDGFSRITGLASREAVGHPLEVLGTSGQEGADVSLFESEPVRIETTAHRRGGIDYALEVQVVPVPTKGERPSHWIGILRDVSERKAQMAALQHQALYDFLTGLPNRFLLRDRLEQAVLQSLRDGAVLALMFLDLDRFKEINDTFGHYAGDLLLTQIGDRLRTELRGSDTIARLGGDEFAILLPIVDGERGAVIAARKLLKSLEKPFTLEGHRLDVSASIGIALCPIHGAESMTLMRLADVAMYAAKHSSAGYTLYTSSIDTASPAQLLLMGELRSGIENDEFRLYYQPKVDLRTGRVCDFEALVRWQHAREGLMLPEGFLPNAERTGLIRPLGQWVLGKALVECRKWQDAGVNAGVAVNLSTRSLQDPHLAATIKRLLRKSRLEPSLLILEITESSIMADPELARSILAAIRGSGVRLSLDDFGTGYSSLAHLKQLSLDEIKIDRSFVSDMMRDENNAVIVRSTIDLGHSLGRKVVAEGVEEEAILAELASLGCDYAQGHYLSPPLPAEELIPWLNRARVKLAR
jgi:diguanylate cyclase (GGDEF)-like protein/PAS domain S-box-containing protein